MNDIMMDKEFFDIADTFINLVNEHCKKVGNEKAGFALTYAAARFNSFLVASNSVDLDELKAVRQEAKYHFIPVYEKDIDRNLDDYENNYDRYIEKH